MLEVKLLIDELDYDAVLDLALPILADKLEEKGGLAGKVAGKKEYIGQKLHRLLQKWGREKTEAKAVDLATKKRDLLIEKATAAAAKKGISVNIRDIAVRKI